jgi:hypothetical protein
MAAVASDLKHDIAKEAEICWRADEAHGRRKLWHSVLNEAYTMTNPFRNPYDGREKGAPASMNALFDSTALLSTFRTTNRLLMDLVPPDQEWLGLVTGPALDLRISQPEKEQVEATLEIIQSLVSMVFRGERFVNAIWEVFLDMLISGLGAMLVLEDVNNDQEPVIFQCVSQAEIAVEDGPDGSECAVYRYPEMKVRNIKRMWSEAKFNDELNEMMKDDKSKNKNVKLLEACVKDPKTGQWIYKVMYRAKESDPFVMLERTYATNPWILFRYSKIPGCEYGPGPVLLSLPDIRTANKVMEFLLKNAALALSGMYLVRDDGVINPDNVQIVAGGMVAVQSTGGPNASMVPLTTNREFDLGQIILRDLQGKVKQGLFDVSLPAADGTRRSATEIIERMRMLTQDVGGAIGRMTSALVALVRRVVDVMGTRGLIPPIKIDNFALRVQVNSPLAQSQQLQQVQKIVQWIEICKAVGGDDLTALVAKLEDILVWIAKQVGVPNALVRNQSERKAERERMEEVAMRQATAQLAAQAA